MFTHVILGLLREGEQCHGYELAREYRARSGSRIGVGGFYRDLARLAAGGLVETSANPPDADPRRIPYRTTEHGRRLFDEWLAAPAKDEAEFGAWLLFADRAPREARDRLLDRRQEDLWIQLTMLRRVRDDGPNGAGPTRVCWALITRQMKQVSGELEFLEDLRKQLGGSLPERNARETPLATHPARRRAASG